MLTTAPRRALPVLVALLGVTALAGLPGASAQVTPGPYGYVPKLVLLGDGGEDLLEAPRGIAATADAVFVASSGNDAIAGLEVPGDTGMAAGSAEPGAVDEPQPSDADWYLFTDADGEVDSPEDLTVGPNGIVFFTSAGNDRIGRLDPDTEEITTFDDPEGEVDFPQGIVVGPEGNVWFTSVLNDRIGRLQPNGNITTTTSPEVDVPRDIVVGPDGALWFASNGTDRLGRVDPTTGTITTFADVGGQVDAPFGLAVGPDGRLWFAMQNTGSGGGVGAFDPDTGTYETFAGAPFVTPQDIALGADGNLWVTDNDAGIVRVTPSGVATLVVEPAPPAEATLEAPRAIANGPALHGLPPDGNDGSSAPAAEPAERLWFTDDAVVGALDPTTTFADVDLDHPFVDEVEWMAATGISTGYADATYKPAAAVTRQAMSAFMFRLAGLPIGPSPDAVARDDGPAEGPSFSDVAEDHPFFAEIEWMAANGISTGYADGTYRPADVVTRQAMSAFMFRLADLLEEDVTAAGAADGPAEGPSFSDVAEDHPFFAEIEWMAANGISTGYADGTYKPAAAVSRQAMSAFMFRLFFEVLVPAAQPS